MILVVFQLRSLQLIMTLLFTFLVRTSSGPTSENCRILPRYNPLHIPELIEALQELEVFPLHILFHPYPNDSQNKWNAIRQACKRKGDLAKHMRSHPEPHPELPDASPQLAKPRRRRPNVSTEEDAADDGVEVDASSSSEEPVKLEPFAIEAILSQQQQHQQQQQLQQQLQQQQEQQEQQLASVGDSEQLAEDDANNSQQLVNGFQCKTCFKVQSNRFLTSIEWRNSRPLTSWDLGSWLALSRLLLPVFSLV